MGGRLRQIFVAVAVASAMPANATETLNYGLPPAWAVSPAIPAPTPADERPVEVLVHDQQILVEPGKTTTYTEVALKIRTADGLAVGNVSIPWQPATDRVTVNKLQIRRDGETIDVLASGQKFTTMRREANLEAAMLDGQLTANIQPEDLQVGDILVLATTVEQSDPVLQDHIQLSFGNWGGLPIRQARARVVWPADLDLRYRFAGGLPNATERTEGKKKILELKLSDLEPLIPPKGAPNRFLMGRMVEGTNYRSWGQIGKLMEPLYKTAAAIPQSGPLRDEVEKIRRSTPDPLLRAGKALDLVQDRVRYVALLMGQGGYVPASAEETWSRRYGDCKAKTALLLALLHELDIDAHPVAVHSSLGDAVTERLPLVAAFDHVLVRAQIAGKDYWLDGTRTGDGKLDAIPVPAFHWGLPLVAGSKLVRIMPAPLTVPHSDQVIDIDASAGVHAPARVTIEERMRGDGAKAVNTLLTQASSSQREQIFRDYAKRFFDSIAVTDSSMQFDQQTGELQLSVKGDAKLEWDGVWYRVPSSSLAFDPDFDRQNGAFADAPLAVPHPQYNRSRVVMRLPPGFAEGQKLPTSVSETLAGVEYTRTAGLSGDVLTIEKSERTTGPEIAYEAGRAAERRLKALADDDVYLRVQAAYRPTKDDLAATLQDKPASAKAFFDRGLMLFNARKYDEAIGDFTAALQLDPKDEWALANRGLSYVWKQDFVSAERDLAAAEAITPTNPVAARARGLIAEMKGDFSTAVEHFSRSLQQDRKNDFALAHRAAAYRALGEHDKALSDTEELIASGHGKTEVRLLRANLLRQMGKRDLAIKEADLLVTENPSSDFALVAAARIYAALDAPEQAMRAYDKALAVEPLAYIYLNRAQSRPASDLQGRLADLELALKLEPDNPDVLAFKASLLAKQEKYAEALDLYARLLKDAPDELHYAAIERAIVLYKAGRVAEAEKAFAAIAGKAKTAPDFNNLCWVKATAGILLQSALEDCGKALEMAPESGPYVDSLGMVLLKLGRLDEALKAYDKAVSKKVGSASLMGRSFVHARKGDTARAEADRAEALKLDPDAERRFEDYGLKL